MPSQPLPPLETLLQIFGYPTIFADATKITIRPLRRYTILIATFQDGRKIKKCFRLP